MVQRGTRPMQRYSCPIRKLRTQAGLTLMELMVVVALIFLVIGMVYSFFSFINTSSLRGGDQYQLQSNIGAALDFISKEIRNSIEIEIVPDSDLSDPDAEYQYIYVEGKVLKHRNAGTVTDKTESVINTDAAIFTVRKDETSGRYYITIDLAGKKRDDQYNLSTEILLNNITGFTGEASGNAVRYKK